MQIFRYRFTELGWLGVVLFVTPTPLGFIVAHQYMSDRFGQIGPGILAMSGFLSTATLVGVALMLIGRELVAAAPSAASAYHQAPPRLQR